MALPNSVVSDGLKVEQWDDEFFIEYNRENRFKPYMSTSSSAIICVKEDLETKVGDGITINLLNDLVGAGGDENVDAEGNEEVIGLRSFKINIHEVHHAVAHKTYDEQLTEIDLRKASKEGLKTWFMKKMRDDIIKALGSINRVPYATASAAQKNAWQVDNTDRILYGKAIGNTVAGDHAASLLNVDAANDRVTAATLKLLKRRALDASPAIHPTKTKGDEEWYVVFCNSRAFRDLSEDPAILQANRDARPRIVDDNPLFTGGELVYDGMIIRQISEIPVYAGVGAAAVDVSPVYLCGAQAIGVAWARRFKSDPAVYRYKVQKQGLIGIEYRGIEKILFGSGATDTADLKDHGVATLFAATPPDA